MFQILREFGAPSLYRSGSKRKIAGERAPAMIRTVFYSWQSDLDKATNHNLIDRALESAAKRIRRDETIKVHPVIDRDAQGLTGSPDISAAIFSKIEEASIFIADVSIINPRARRRRTPNPNVLIELGYAMKHLGSERVLLVFNTASGRVEDLPFDIRPKRVIKYHLAKGSAAKVDVRNGLSSQFEAAIRDILKITPPRPAVELVFDGGVKELNIDKKPSDFLQKEEIKAELRARIVCLNMMLQNTGQVPVTHVRCVLDFPVDVRLMNRDALESFWSAYPNDEFSALLEKWEREDSFTDSISMRDLSQGVYFHIFESGLELRIDRPKYAPKRDLKGEISGRMVEFQTRKLQQESIQMLEPLYILFYGKSAAGSFAIEYRLESDNVVSTGTLHVTVHQEGS
jgi:hypothetical protein